MKSWIVAGVALAATLSLSPLHAASPLSGLDGYVRHAMHASRTPGLALAVVKDGKVVLARGYGVRTLGKPGKVDADTLFDIGSNTKAFTAAALGTLVSAGKFGWDTRAVDELKDFRLGGAYVTQHTTLRDLLTHRTGFCDPTMAWYTSNDADMFKRLRYQKPDFGFRAHFCYNNMTYLAASRFIPAATGQGWNRYLADHLLKPLDMRRTVTGNAALVASTDVASPHGLVDGAPAVIPRYWPHNMDITAPIGGINTSARDMSHWMLMLLDNGRYDGRKVLDPSVIQAMETPQIPIAPDTGDGKVLREWMPGGRLYSYGLGFFLQAWAGNELVWHAGDIDGMASVMVLVPRERLGIVVMTNMDHTGARFGVAMHLLQGYLGQPAHDVGADLLARQEKRAKALKAMLAKLAAMRKPGQATPVPLARYAGRYAGKLDGTAKVTLHDGHLVLHLGNPAFTGTLEHWHDDTFHVTWRERFYRGYGLNYVTFTQDLEGRPDTLSLPQAKLHYKRLAAHGPGAGSSAGR